MMELDQAHQFDKTGVFSYSPQEGERVFSHFKVKLSASWACSGKPLSVGFLDTSPDIKEVMLVYVWLYGDDLYELILENDSVFITTEKFEGEGKKPSVAGDVLKDLFESKVRIGSSFHGKSGKSVWAMSNPNKRDEVKSILLYDEGSDLVYQFLEKNGKLIYNK